MVRTYRVVIIISLERPGNAFFQAVTAHMRIAYKTVAIRGCPDALKEKLRRTSQVYTTGRMHWGCRLEARAGE